MKNPIALSLFMLICGCTGYEYVSVPHYVPLNTEKGELNANVSLFNFQIGYAFANHFSIFSAGNYRNGGLVTGSDGKPVRIFDSQDYYNDKASEFDVGLSYFKKYKIFVFEVLGGAGTGRLEYEHTRDLVNDYQFNLNTDRYNFFVQPDVGILIGSHLAMGGSAKFSQYICNHIKTEVIQGDNDKNIASDNYFIGKKTTNLYFFEPAFTIRGGFSNFKVQAQVMDVMNWTNSKINFRNPNIFVSFSVNLNVLKSKKDESKNP